jgi:hypothetical protein
VGRKEDLDDLIIAFDRAVHEDHPNPERIGCPGRPALTRLATQPRDSESGAILDHIRECASCLDELRALRGSRKRSQQ